MGYKRNLSLLRFYTRGELLNLANFWTEYYDC